MQRWRKRPRQQGVITRMVSEASVQPHVYTLTCPCSAAGDSDDAFLRKRAEAMEALTRIEIEFARLRDRLYVERMTEVEKERIGVEDGTYRARCRLRLKR